MAYALYFELGAADGALQCAVQGRQGAALALYMPKTRQFFSERDEQKFKEAVKTLGGDG